MKIEVNLFRGLRKLVLFKVFSTTLLFSCLTNVSYAGIPGSIKTLMPSPVLEFEDNFEYGRLDGFMTGYPWGDIHRGNNNTVFNPDLVVLPRNGNVELKTKLRDNTYWNNELPYHWDTGTIYVPNVDLSYGSVYIEADLNLPNTQYGWPAFWLTSTQGWPPEIDILEQPVNRNDYYVAIHEPKNKPSVGGGDAGGGGQYINRNTKGWNTYGVFFGAGRVEFFFNGKSVRRFNKNLYANGLRHSYHLIFNHAVGSGGYGKRGWGGEQTEMRNLWRNNNVSETVYRVSNVRIYRQ